MPKIIALALLVTTSVAAQAQPPFAQAQLPAVQAQPPIADLYTPSTTTEQSPHQVAPQRLDECQVVARINDHVILACEVMWEVNLILAENIDRIPPDRVEEARAQIMRRQLQGIVDSKLLYADFRRKARGADLDSIRKQLTGPFFEGGSRGDSPGSVPGLMKALKVSTIAELEKKLVEMGTSLSDRQEAFFEQSVAQQWMREQVKVDKPDHVELVEYYQEHLSDYAFPTQSRWEELSVQFSQHPSPEVARAKMAEAGNVAWGLQQKNPQPSKAIFTKIAPQYSDSYNAKEGGLHDWTTQGALRNQAIDKALFSLPIGSMSPMIEGPASLHIVRVVERRQAGHTPFLKVQDAIQKMMMNKRYSDQMEKLVTKLRRETRIWTLYTGDTTAEAFLAPPGGAQRR